jgi:cytochrome c553
MKAMHSLRWGTAMRSMPLLLLLFAPAAPAGAQDAPAAAAPCIECHAAAGNRTSLPRLEGQNAAYLKMTLAQYRENHRKAFPMNAVAADLADADIDALAAWFSVQPWTAEPATVDPALIGEGAALTARFECAACHGPAFAGTEVIPRTAGQNPIYLARQLRAFSKGDRYHPPTGNGARMFRLAPDEIEALAAYLGQLGSQAP